VSVAAALSPDVEGRGELMDILVSIRLPITAVRERLLEATPTGFRLVDLHDVWLGLPPLPGQVAMADYAVDTDLTDPVDQQALDAACRSLLGRSSVPRQRPKGGRLVPYDLRPLLVDVRRSRASELLLRTRFDPERGVGRPEEVVAALADELGRPVSIRRLVRNRLVLASEAAPAWAQDEV
jgi:Uncharacterized protein conserved in bacteria (DUF2344)